MLPRRILFRWYWTAPYIGAFYSKRFKKLYIQIVPFFALVLDWYHPMFECNVDENDCF